MRPTFVLLAVLITACHRNDAPPPSNATAPSPPPQATAPWTDGHFVGASAGGRGGSYWYDLCANGTYAHNCLDAICDRGTWQRESGAIVLASSSPDSPGKVTRLALAADGQSFGTAAENGPFVLQGAPSCE